ncbi:hypothetical protein GGTG_04893 [Gaeumannomyces tritici R3-111a-1]|uniref:Uncharacterized protein n=1 Tax=Gaeumannomyces tritici (strain R3-111a-1) TaxID=644352 RepID=J3NUD7_GAET3|nr:hypothetical protein GGTG_04893 [Gaeumannomyces tritici R3-111a-1]EJT79810.1 hypothetical protein GGTG_04893 [Gaeumannomyces tritici R3-111a-1]
MVMNSVHELPPNLPLINSRLGDRRQRAFPIQTIGMALTGRCLYLPILTARSGECGVTPKAPLPPWGVQRGYGRRDGPVGSAVPPAGSCSALAARMAAMGQERETKGRPSSTTSANEVAAPGTSSADGSWREGTAPREEHSRYGVRVYSQSEAQTCRASTAHVVLADNRHHHACTRSSRIPPLVGVSVGRPPKSQSVPSEAGWDRSWSPLGPWLPAWAGFVSTHQKRKTEKEKAFSPFGPTALALRPKRFPTGWAPASQPPVASCHQAGSAHPGAKSPGSSFRAGGLSYVPSA